MLYLYQFVWAAKYRLTPPHARDDGPHEIVYAAHKNRTPFSVIARNRLHAREWVCCVAARR